MNEEGVLFAKSADDTDRVAATFAGLLHDCVARKKPVFPMHITSLYAALLAFLFIALSVRTLRMRGRYRIAIGDGGEPALLRASRAHGNFAEYVPFALVLMAGAEMSGSPAWSTHLAGVVLVVGRVAHALGVSRIAEDFRFRIVGMGCTLTVIGTLAIELLWVSPAGLIDAHSAFR